MALLDEQRVVGLHKRLVLLSILTNTQSILIAFMLVHTCLLVIRLCAHCSTVLVLLVIYGIMYIFNSLKFQNHKGIDPHVEAFWFCC